MSASTTTGGAVALALAAVITAVDGPMSALGLLTVAGGWVAGGVVRAWMDRRRTVRIETPDGRFESGGMALQELQAAADRYAAARKRGDR